MRCPEYLTVSWVEIPPYIYNTSEGTVGGVFHSILTQMVQFCCPSQTNLSFAKNPATRSAFQGILTNGTDDILLPVYGTGKKKDRLGEPFISLGIHFVFLFANASSMYNFVVYKFIIKGFNLCVLGLLSLDARLLTGIFRIELYCSLLCNKNGFYCCIWHLRLVAK